ncbi:aspartate carbamoyltransferase [Patescibacteria group bacterium]|nr:aspartate carbamoyltransferase [Patescibacteria group bacterium]
MNPGHVLVTQAFSTEWLDAQFFPLAKRMNELMENLCQPQENRDRGLLQELKSLQEEFSDTGLISWFAEPSTRTRMSMELAIQYIGGRVAFPTDNASEFSSLIKGESFSDTARVISGYCMPPDRFVVVTRYKQDGASTEMAKYSKVAIINGGDGGGQHPTQALLDFYTIKKRFGQIQNLKVAMVGDLRKGRTVRSLSYLLAKYPGVKLFFVSPEGSRMKLDVINYLRRHNVQFEETGDLLEVAGQVDVINMTRFQTERDEGKRAQIEGWKEYFSITKAVLEKIQKDAIIMHALPRLSEIPGFVDADSRSHYFTQARNGIFTRMALLAMIFRGQIPPIPED